MIIETAADALARLRTALPELRRQLSATHQTPPGWTWLDDTQRARRDAQVRAERAERAGLAARGLAPIGGSHTPVNLTVLDAIRDIELDLAELEDAVCDRVAPELRPARDTDARIARLADLLGLVAADHDLAYHVARETSRMAALAGRVIGDAEPVLRLDRRRCPICDCLSLRAFPDRLLILCVNRACQCEDWLCGCRDDRPTRHEWTFAAWHHLAAQLATQEEAA